MRPSSDFPALGAIRPRFEAMRAWARAAPEVALSGTGPFAMLQREPRIDTEAPPDSAEEWLPEAAEDLDEPDRLDVEPLPLSGSAPRQASGEGDSAREGARTVAQMTAASREGRWALSRLAAEGRDDRHAWAIAALERRGRWNPGLVFSTGGTRGTGGVGGTRRTGVAPRPAASVGGGRLRLGGGGSLFREAMGLQRPLRRPGRAAADPLAIEPAPSLATPALEGVAGTLGRRAGRSRGASAWLALGRLVADGRPEALAGAATRFRSGPGSATDLGVSAGVLGRAGASAPRDEKIAFTVAAARRGRGSLSALELLAAGDERAALVLVERRESPWGFAGRWRYRSRDRDPFAAEVTASAGSRLGLGRAAARITWRPWTSGARADDGRVEIEALAGGFGAGSSRVRVGQSGIGAGGGLPERRERYGLVETTIAEDASRRLSLLATRRVRGASGSVGTTFGGRLELGRGKMTHAEIRVEASRVKGTDAAALGSGLDASGLTDLRSRGRSGLTVAARGAFARRGWSLKYVLERTRSAGEGHPASGRVWLERRIGYE